MFINDILKIKKLGLGGDTPPTSIGYTVTFQVDGDTYYIAECEVGGTISEPPAPIKAGETFTGWYDGESNPITFPYTPSADITLSGEFATVRTEMEIGNENVVKVGGVQVTNNSSDFVLLGIAGTGYACVLSKSALNITGQNNFTQGTTTYDGETWYYGFYSGVGGSVTEANEKAFTTEWDGYTMHPIEKTLDHYYYAD